jgi:hypothetical protein
MARIVVFDGDTAEGCARFDVMYGGVVVAGNRQREKREDQRRRENRVLDMLEAISVRRTDLPDLPDAFECRVLRPGTHRLALEKPEFDLMRRYLDEVPWPATDSPLARSSRIAQRVIDWLGDLKSEEASQVGGMDPPK